MGQHTISTIYMNMEGAGFKVVLLMSLLVAGVVPYGSWAKTTTTTHVVGDSLGWVVPPDGDATYRSWAASKTFTVGDVLVFNFRSGAHDVLEVTKTEFDSCKVSTTAGTAPIFTGPAKIALTTAGEHHFICTVGPHCSLGQKLTVSVVPSTSSSSPSPPHSTTPPPPSNLAATSFAPTVFMFTFFTLALLYLLHN